MKKLVFVLLILSSEFSFSQIYNRNILGNKYTLEQVKSVLEPIQTYKPYPKSKADWKEKVSEEDLMKLIDAGEGALLYNFLPISGTISMDFQRSGDRLRHSGISFEKRNQLLKLVVAESIEDQGRFTEAIFNGVWSICEESYWGVPAHIRGSVLPDIDNPVVDLFAAETAGVLAMTYYFVGDKLDKINPLIRKRIYSETNKRIFVPMLTKSNQYKYMSKTEPVNNWNPWIMSNWMLSTLILESETERRSEMIHKAMLGLDLYLNGLGEDGGCDEGPSYWFAAGASVFDCLELLQNASKNQINVFNNDLIQKMGAYVYKTHIDGHYSVNFADADPKLKHDGLMLYRFGKSINDKQMQELGKWAFNEFFDLDNKQHGQSRNSTDSNYGSMRMRRVENLLTIKEIKGLNHNYSPVKDSWISDIQVLTGRASSGLYLATHGGHNAESHNHNDVGDFIVYLNGQPMIIDAGRGNYTSRTFSAQRYELWFTQSEYHNLPIINNVGQKVGKDFAASKVQSIVNEKEVSLEMNIENAFEKSAGLEAWKRKVKLDRVKNLIELTDDYTLLNEKNKLQQVFMTICKVDLNTKGKIILNGDQSKSLQISYDSKLWDVSLDYPSTEGMEYESFKTKWDSKPVTRIILNAKMPKQKSKHQFLISPTQE